MPGIADLNNIAPLVALTAGALLVIVVDLIVPAKYGRPWSYATAIGAVLLTGWYLTDTWRAVQAGPATSFFGTVTSDKLSVILAGLLLTATLFVVLMSLASRTRDMAGYLSLVLFAAVGMIVLGGAGDLMVLFVSLEVFSLGLYSLVAFQRDRIAAREGAFKYFLLGSVASGFLLYGFALIYGATGAISLADIAAYAATGNIAPLYHAGFALALVGFAFKLALVPFHMWAPDAYQAAPTPVTAFMAVGTKAAALVALARFVWAVVPTQPELADRYMAPLAVLAVFSMIVGSLATLFQTNLKRLLAYSGITHAGYLLMPLVGLQAEGMRLSMFYLFGYMFMSMGAFAVISALQARGERGDELEAHHGLYSRHPWLAGLLAFFFLAMAGMPPTAGLTGKLFLITGGLQAGAGGLVAALVISTGISAYAYLRVVLTAFRRVSDKPEDVAAMAPMAGGDGTDEAQAWTVAWTDVGIGAVMIIAVVGTLALGLFPETLLGMLEGLLPLR